MDPLPYEPPFPVLGLDRSFSGNRYLGVWNLSAEHRGEVLFEIPLWHGRTPRPPWLLVNTTVNAAAYDWAEVLGPGYSGIQRAATAALGAAVSLSDRLDVHTPIYEWAESLSEPLWQHRQVTVSGQPTPCWVMEWADVWSAVTDVGSVSVGMCGSGFDLTEIALEPVNDRLDQYAHRRRPPESLQRLRRTLLPPPPQGDPPPVHDARLDPYRDRAARLSDEQGVVGQVLIKAVTSWQDVSRVPWSRRWEAREVPWCCLLLDHGGGGLWSVPTRKLEATLAEWAQNRFPCPDEVSDTVAGTTLSLEWLDEETTRRLRGQVEFGFTAD